MTLSLVKFMSDESIRQTRSTSLNLNLPNAITLLRFIITIVFISLASIQMDRVEDSLCYWRIAFILAILAGGTDFIDGYLARRYNQVTDLGKLLDPLTDKVFTLSSFIILTYYHWVPIWVTCLILSREFAVSGLRQIAATQGSVISAKWIGKWKTVLQMLVLALGGCFWVRWLPLDLNTKSPLWLYWIWQIILILITIFTIYSGVEYFWKGRRFYVSSQNSGAEKKEPERSGS
ncbi:MAG: CDP-diacylglycerol--glycerol-3-phosphate 3-phosphatidyltransferase [Lentisphaerae bacterium]|nr:MAG: CDP-diacylglycerol--glycerol-3-phosphate 3-phosphatidyltransferase [Lentisphaerota bacterium]